MGSVGFLHTTTGTSFGMLAVGARGATQVRGKDSVHPEWLSKQSHELFSRPTERTTGTKGTRREARPGKELI